MALGQPGKGEIRLICKKPALPEFPKLLFGEDPKTKRSYFDATSYLNAIKGRQIPLQQFFTEWRAPISALCHTYQIDSDTVCLINEQGHHLIDGTFCYLFISFVDPGFLAYMNERIHELFCEGVAVSDTYLLEAAQKRLSREVLTALSGDEKVNT